MIDEINKAIKESLPQKIGEELQTELAQLALLREQVKAFTKTVEENNLEISRLRQIEKRAQSLDALEARLQKDIMKFETDKRDLHIELLKEKYTDVKSLMHDVFRNQKMVYQKYGSTDAVYEDQYGTKHTFPVANNSTTEIVEE